MSEKIVQTAGREQLGEFAPMFAHLNDDVLFGEVWNEEAIDVKTKCIITVVSLMASGITDSSLTYHLQNAKTHGVTKEEIAAIITHATMYVGWPKGWAVFRLAKEVWNETTGSHILQQRLPEKRHVLNGLKPCQMKTMANYHKWLREQKKSKTDEKSGFAENANPLFG